jgi:glycerol 2-dehydrogenase (NADP+)
MHPLLPQIELLTYCRQRSIVLTAYSPIGKHKEILVTHPAVVSAIARLGCTAAQVLLSWNITRGVVVVPKTANKQRIEENLVVSAINLIVCQTFIHHVLSSSICCPRR